MRRGDKNDASPVGLDSLLVRSSVAGRLELRGVRFSWSLFVAILSAGCGPSLPGTLVDESAHFRLFVDPDLDPSALAPAQQSLDALETDWADKQTMLKMPEGKQKIDYHLLTSAHVSDVCGFAESGDPNESVDPAGCEVTGTLQIAANYLPHQHELVHAYLDLITSGRVSVPLVVEGMAESIGCGTSSSTDLTYDVPWQQAVSEGAEDPAQDVYIEGGLFARYLIRTQGIDAWVRYYRQAPQRRDPALFAENFSAFWNMTVDDVWTAMHVVSADAATTDRTICPCSLPTIPVDGQPIPASPYWTLGDTAVTAIAVTASNTREIVVYDCEGVTPPIAAGGQGTPPYVPAVADANVAILQLEDGRPRYIPAPISGASAGQYLADSCGAATPYALPADFVSGAGKLWIFAGPADRESVTKYLQLQFPTAAQVTPGVGVGICDSCAFEQGSCPGPAGPYVGGPSSSVAAGPLDAEVILTQIPWGPEKLDLVGTTLQLAN
jgi:hypothetical protein